MNLAVYEAKIDLCILLSSYRCKVWTKYEQSKFEFDTT